MSKLTALLLIFSIYLEYTECGVYRNGPAQSRSGFVGRRNSYIGSSPTTSTTTTTPGPMTPKEYLQTKGTFSAFTLILVIVSVIVMGLGLYYGVLCYPLVCRSEKNYQFMDVSSTMTGATSRSIQSIENFQTGKSMDNYPISEKSHDTFPSSAAIAPEKPPMIDEFVHHHQEPHINSISVQK